MITVSISVTPGGAILGILIISAGVAVGIGAAHLISENSEKIAAEAKALWGKVK
jgi:hypothetical protein